MLMDNPKYQPDKVPNPPELPVNMMLVNSLSQANTSFHKLLHMISEKSQYFHKFNFTVIWITEKPRDLKNYMYTLTLTCFFLRNVVIIWSQTKEFPMSSEINSETLHNTETKTTSEKFPN